MATGNLKPSNMLHTSKDFAKCKYLSQERKNMYNGRIVTIDLSATCQDFSIDLSSLASYKAFICLRVSMGVLACVGTSVVTLRRIYLCCFFLAGVCFGVGVCRRRSLLGLLYMRSAIPPTCFFHYGFASCHPSSPPLFLAIPSFSSPCLPPSSPRPFP